MVGVGRCRGLAPFSGGAVVTRPAWEGTEAGWRRLCAGDLLAAFDGAQEGSGEAAAVGDRRGVGVEQADQGVDVPGFPCRLERPDDGGLLGCRTRGSLRRANAAAG